jgi:hypothetical protein
MTYTKRVAMQMQEGKHQQCEKEVAPMWAIALAQEKQPSD